MKPQTNSLDFKLVTPILSPGLHCRRGDCHFDRTIEDRYLVIKVTLKLHTSEYILQILQCVNVKYLQNYVVGYFIQIEQLLATGGYSYEDSLIVACPTPEQVSVFISSASLISHSEPVQPYGVKATANKSVVRKPSVSRVQETDEKDKNMETELIA